jgi:flagellar hook protein FlgE
MGIFDAMTTAVGGLQAQSFALENISGNISNSQTTAYKETDTKFSDLVSAAALGQQTAGGVIAGSVATNTVQGGIQSASVSTYMAINGDGWFVVAKPTAFSDNQPVFDGVNLYTRRGDFQSNQNGNLVNGAGYYLMGIPVDPTTGNPTGSVPQVLQFTNNFMPAHETSAIQYQANLASNPATASFSSSVPGSELLNPVGFQSNPLAGAPSAAIITGTGATLLPDAFAKGTGTAAGLVGSNPITSVLAVGDTVTINDGTNTGTYTVTAGDTDSISTFLSTLTAGTSITAAINGSGNITFTGNTYTTSITLGGNAANKIGFGAGQNSFLPTNLLTQNAVGQGQTMTFTDTPPGGGTPTSQTITFGTNPGEINTLAGLQTALQGLTVVKGTLDTANGNMTIAANNTTDALSITGNSAAAKFGIHTLNAYPANETVIANDVATFTNESIAGGSVTCYDSVGNAVNVEFRWAKTSSVQVGGADQWQLFYQTNSNATGTQTAWQNVGTVFTFGSNGELTPPLTSLTLANLSVNGDSLGNVQLQLGTNGLTQFADASGTAQVNDLQQNGFPAGKLQSVAIDSQNRVQGTFSNGETIPLADITLATFNGQNYMTALNGGAYAATADSGPPLFSATGTIVGSSLEGSNVDIATQFSQLIVAQQAYSANARVMTVANQMIQSLLTVIQ